MIWYCVFARLAELLGEELFVILLGFHEGFLEKIGIYKSQQSKLCS